MLRALMFLLTVIGIALLLDFYSFKGLRMVLTDWFPGFSRKTFAWVYWGISVVYFLTLIFYSIGGRSSGARGFWVWLVGFFVLLYVPKIVLFLFHFTEDLIHWTRLLIEKIQGTKTSYAGEGITRWKFLTQIGSFLATIPFLGIIYGMWKGKYNYYVNHQSLAFPHLPDAFEGMKIVHISDMHIGSFQNNYEEVKRGFDMINAQNPDLILFTGDMVNYHADETDGWLEYLSQLKAKHGVFSILGNHDYADYTRLPREQKDASIEKLKNFQKSAGFRLLLDEHVEIDVDGQKIGLIGIQNWGDGFAQYGDLGKAINGAQMDMFNILMSHDPSHWEAQVLNKENIDLTLSGHTHGMQFGVDIPGFKWSPVQYRYRRWGGLYREGNQLLFVNRGFGFIGFHGRVGIKPEITLIELKKGELPS